MEFQNTLEGIKDNLCPVRYLNGEDGQYFFGYYDLRPYSDNGKRHLANRLPFVDHLNTGDDTLEMGWLEDGVFTPFRTTKSWCFQQGAMFQFEYDNENIVFYNVWNEAAHEYHTVKENLVTGEKSVSALACANVSRDGRYGVAVNFGRIWNFRPGYGYCNKPDPFFDVAAPEDDGVFLCDFKTGSCRKIVDYARFVREFPIPGKETAKYVVNHITFNPSGNRFLMLMRNFPDGTSKAWMTSLVTCDLEGNMRMVAKDTYVSHYWWTDDTHILAHCTPVGEEKKSVFLLEDSDVPSYEEISTPAMDGEGDIHCIVSPDGKTMIGDSYPDKEGYRHIRIMDLESRRSAILLYSKTVKPSVIDIRCDLHVRFDRSGKRISFDAFQRGRRDIVEVDISDLKL